MATDKALHTLKWLDWAAAAVLAVSAATAFFLYGTDPSPIAAVAPDESNAVRVEIQRYLGYEILPVRYLSLPYDLTMNSNVYLPILDTGVLLLIFVPLAVLLGLVGGEKKGWKAWLPALAVVLSCFFLVVISTANGYISGNGLGMVKPAELDKYLATTSFGDAPVGVVCSHFYKIFLGIYQGAIEPVLLQFSGNADAVTYPLMLLLFAIFVYIGAWRFRHLALPQKSLLYFTYAYLFFWLMLSAGIVWYGLLAFPLLTAFVFSAMLAQGRVGGLAGRVGQYAFFGVAGLYLLMGFVHRFSNLNLSIMANDPSAGKRIYDPAYVRYLTGDFTEEKVFDAYYPGLGNALRSINAEDQSLIYSVGTRFNFFIRANDKRIFKDNQLDLFNQIISKYQTKAQVTALLKASGFRYLMVDFNTPTGDRTPEQSLVERYKKFLLLFYQNPEIELLATNRVLQESTNGQVEYKYGVFGEVKEPGSYAIFKIK
jgi:hypothetical protein